MISSQNYAGIKHENEHVRSTVKAKPNTGNKDGFKFGGVSLSTVQMTTLPSKAVK